MLVSDYLEESGFPKRAMDRLLHSYLADKFSFRNGNGKTTPFWIITPVFEAMQERGDFKDILEG